MSNVISQKDAVKNAIRKVLTEANVSFDENTNFKSVMTKELRAQVNQILFEGFKAGTIALKDTESNREKLADDKKLRNYVSGVQSNWLDKDTDLTAGIRFMTKNPGSRFGEKDEQIKNMRALQAQHTDAEDYDLIEGHIMARKEELRKEKALTKKNAKPQIVDYSKLPAGLQKFQA